MAEHYEDNKRKAHAKDERGEDPPSPPSALAYADRSRKGFRRVAESLVHVIHESNRRFPGPRRWRVAAVMLDGRHPPPSVIRANKRDAVRRQRPSQ